MPEKRLHVPDVARLIARHEATVYRLLQEGKIDYDRIDRRIVVTQAAAEAYLRGRTEPPPRRRGEARSTE